MSSKFGVQRPLFHRLIDTHSLTSRRVEGFEAECAHYITWQQLSKSPVFASLNTVNFHMKFASQWPWLEPPRCQVEPPDSISPGMFPCLPNRTSRQVQGCVKRQRQRQIIPHQGALCCLISTRPLLFLNRKTEKPSIKSSI